MSLETDLRAALKGTVTDRMYPGTFPQSPTIPVCPAIRYIRISATPNPDLCGDGGDDQADVRIQFDIVDTTYLGVQAVRTSVMTILAAFATPAIWDGEFNEFDSETKLHRCTLDYLFYPSSAPGSPA